MVHGFSNASNAILFAILRVSRSVLNRNRLWNMCNVTQSQFMYIHRYANVQHAICVACGPATAVVNPHVVLVALICHPVLVRVTSSEKHENGVLKGPGNVSRNDCAFMLAQFKITFSLVRSQ